MLSIFIFLSAVNHGNPHLTFTTLQGFLFITPNFFDPQASLHYHQGPHFCVHLSVVGHMYNGSISQNSFQGLLSSFQPVCDIIYLFVASFAILTYLGITSFTMLTILPRSTTSYTSLKLPRILSLSPNGHKIIKTIVGSFQGRHSLCSCGIMTPLSALSSIH